MRLIDLDDDDIVYCGDDGEYVKYNIPSDMPTMDAVPVIRCKDCKWYEPRILKCNNSKSTEWHPDDYCSDAERKDECGQRSAD